MGLLRYQQEMLRWFSVKRDRRRSAESEKQYPIREFRGVSVTYTVMDDEPEEGVYGQWRDPRDTL